MEQGLPEDVAANDTNSLIVRINNHDDDKDILDADGQVCLECIHKKNEQ